MEEVKRKENEFDKRKKDLEHQIDMIKARQEEIDKLHRKQVEQLETMAGISADDAKTQLIESLKPKAKQSRKKSCCRLKKNSSS